MKVMVLRTDRYGERAIQKEVLDLPIEKLTKKLVNQAFKASKYWTCDEVNDDGEEFDSDEEAKAYQTHLMDDAIISKDGSTAHHSGEEHDYIFIVV